MTAREDIYTDTSLLVLLVLARYRVCGKTVGAGNNNNIIMDEQSANLSKSLGANISIDRKTRHDGVVKTQK